jgi:hypothetical protein
MDRSTRFNGSRASGTGIYGNAIVPRENLDDNEPELTAAQIKQAYNEALREDQAHQNTLATQQNGESWIAGHPEVVDSVPNARILVNQVRTMFGDGLITINMFEQAYQYLREKTDFLALDKTVLAAQQKQAAKQRYEAEKARTSHTSFDPNADYSSLSLDEIKRRAEQANSESMRRLAEEGGY